jgi:hypothetical protein
MLKEIHLENNKKIFLMFLILLVFGILVVFVFDVNCVFKTITGIPCPGCGLSRGFRALFLGDFLKAERYNILTIPIFIFFVCSLILMIIDFFKKTNKVEKFLNKLSRYYLIIIFMILSSFIINVIRGI